jgi:hypothetical protein
MMGLLHSSESGSLYLAACSFNFQHLIWVCTFICFLRYKMAQYWQNILNLCVLQLDRIPFSQVASIAGVQQESSY